MARYLLYFTAEDHYLYASSGARLQLEAQFPGDDAGVVQFHEYLRRRKGALFAVVADLAGEDFQEEQIPFLRGADREAVVQRRLAQRYRDTRLAAALSLGMVTTVQRKNERLLLASFTNTQQFVPWLDALEQSGARLAGVYSVPLLAPALAASLGVHRGRALVVTVDRAGLRQSFVEDGRLRFARLERTADMQPHALAAFIRSETLRLVQYLVSLRALPREGAPLPVMVIAPRGERAVFEQTLVPDGRVAFRTIDAAQAFAAVKLPQAPEGTAAEALYLHLAARKPPKAQFASSGERRRYFMWQLQRALVGAGVLGFAACALLAATRAYEAHDFRVRATELAGEARSAAERYQRITASFPVTETTTENLRVAVLEFRRLAEASAQPDPAFIHTSRVLERFPQVELDAIQWSLGRPGEPRSAEARPPATSVPRSEQAVQIELSGRVNATQRNDYRGITAQVQAFATALATNGYQVVRMQLPFDVTSEGTLTGDIGGRDSSEAPRFTITVARSLP